MFRGLIDTLTVHLQLAHCGTVCSFPMNSLFPSQIREFLSFPFFHFWIIEAKAVLVLDTSLRPVNRLLPGSLLFTILETFFLSVDTRYKLLLVSFPPLINFSCRSTCSCTSLPSTTPSNYFKSNIHGPSQWMKNNSHHFSAYLWKSDCSYTPSFPFKQASSRWARTQPTVQDTSHLKSGHSLNPSTFCKLTDSYTVKSEAFCLQETSSPLGTAKLSIYITASPMRRLKRPSGSSPSSPNTDWSL